MIACPYCASPITVHSDGTGECSQSGASFSAHLVEELERVFGTELYPVSDERPVAESTGSNEASAAPDWYCPRCAVGTLATSDGQRCPQCDATLGPFIYELIERNPHP